MTLYLYFINQLVYCKQAKIFRGRRTHKDRIESKLVSVCAVGFTTDGTVTDLVHINPRDKTLKGNRFHLWLKNTSSYRKRNKIQTFNWKGKNGSKDNGHDNKTRREYVGLIVHSVVGPHCHTDCFCLYRVEYNKGFLNRGPPLKIKPPKRRFTFGLMIPTKRWVYEEDGQLIVLL